MACGIKEQSSLNESEKLSIQAALYKWVNSRHGNVNFVVKYQHMSWKKPSALKRWKHRQRRRLQYSSRDGGFREIGREM